MQLSLISDVGSDATLTKSSGDTQVCSLSILLPFSSVLLIFLYSVCVCCFLGVVAAAYTVVCRAKQVKATLSRAFNVIRC